MTSWWERLIDLSNRSNAKPERAEVSPSRSPVPLRRQRFSGSFCFTRVQWVENQDEAITATHDRAILALIADGSKLKWLVFHCPCGCGDLLRISLSRAIRPAWRIRLGRNGEISLYPSIDRSSGCRSHFILTCNIARML
jgi:hypothetical protein